MRAATEDRRAELASLRVGELKERIRSLRVRVTAGDCVEKKDLVSAILNHRRRRAELEAETGSTTGLLLAAPEALARPGEPWAKVRCRPPTALPLCHD